MSFDDFISNLSYFLIIINTLLFIITYNNKDKALKYLIMYLMLCLFIQLYSNYLSDLNEHNLFLSHYLFIGQFVFLSLFYTSLYNFKKHNIIILLVTFLIVFTFIIYLKATPTVYEKWSVLEIIITSIPLIIYSFYFFIERIKDSNNTKYIYFNSGFFVYTFCSTLIFTSGNIGSKELKAYVWLFNNLLYIIYQMMILVEWYINFKPPLSLKRN